MCISTSSTLYIRKQFVENTSISDKQLYSKGTYTVPGSFIKLEGDSKVRSCMSKIGKIRKQSEEKKYPHNNNKQQPKTVRNKLTFHKFYTKFTTIFPK